MASDTGELSFRSLLGIFFAVRCFFLRSQFCRGDEWVFQQGKFCGRSRIIRYTCWEFFVRRQSLQCAMSRGLVRVQNICHLFVWALANCTDFRELGACIVDVWKQYIKLRLPTNIKSVWIYWLKLWHACDIEIFIEGSGRLVWAQTVHAWTISLQIFFWSPSSSALPQRLFSISHVRP